jgi:hypothetical protein
MQSNAIELGRRYWVFDAGTIIQVTPVSRAVTIQDAWLCDDADTAVLVESKAFLREASEVSQEKGETCSAPQVVMLESIATPTFALSFAETTATV